VPPMCCLLGFGLVSARPAVEIAPPLLPLLLALLPLLLLDDLLLEPHAASATTQAITNTGVSVSRNRRIDLPPLVFICDVRGCT
jgi:hypothetical protein